MSGLSSAQVRSEVTLKGAKNQSFGAQFPSTHTVSPTDDCQIYGSKELSRPRQEQGRPNAWNSQAIAAEKPSHHQGKSVGVDTEEDGLSAKAGGNTAPDRSKAHAQRSPPSFSA